MALELSRTTAASGDPVEKTDWARCATGKAKLRVFSAGPQISNACALSAFHQAPAIFMRRRAKGHYHTDNTCRTLSSVAAIYPVNQTLKMIPVKQKTTANDSPAASGPHPSEERGFENNVQKKVLSVHKLTHRVIFSGDISGMVLDSLYRSGECN